MARPATLTSRRRPGQSFTVPFCTWMLMGYFRSIPPELEEHAMVDGIFQGLAAGSVKG